MTEKRDRELLDTYVKNGHKTVDGWLLDEAISLIVRIAEIQKANQVKGHACEIGVHHGRLLILLYLLTEPSEKIVAVDVFDQQEFNVDKSGVGDLDKLFENVQKHCLSSDKLRIIKSDSTKISSGDIENAAGGKVRLFSIDGGHTANVVLHDLETASGSLCQGGVILIDDYFHEMWPEVSIGVNQFFSSGKHNLRPFCIGGNKMLCTTADYADRYFDIASTWNLGRYSKTADLFGHKVVCHAAVQLVEPAASPEQEKLIEVLDACNAEQKEEIEKLHRQIATTYNSVSWLITRPLREIKRLVLAPLSARGNRQCYKNN